MYYNPYYQHYGPTPPSTYGPLHTLGAPAPVYLILLIGMVLFMASNAMPALTPDPGKIGSAARFTHGWLAMLTGSNVAPFVLQWGFVLILFALMAQMTGILPGVPRLHITYVHLTVAFLMWVDHFR